MNEFSPMYHPAYQYAPSELWHQVYCAATVRHLDAIKAYDLACNACDLIEKKALAAAAALPIQPRQAPTDPNAPPAWFIRAQQEAKANQEALELRNRQLEAQLRDARNGAPQVHRGEDRHPLPHPEDGQG